VLGAAVALSATSFPGGMLGFLFAIGAVFFAAVPGGVIRNALDQAGVPLTGKDLAWVLAGSTCCSFLWQAYEHGACSGIAT